MAKKLAVGAYDRLGLVGDDVADGNEVVHSPLGDEVSHKTVARYLSQLTESALRSLPSEERAQAASELGNLLVEFLSEHTPRSGLGVDDQIDLPPRILHALHAPPPIGRPPTVPLTPLAETVLFTNAPGEPGVGSEIGRELDSADQVDVLVAFVKWTGIRLIEDQLRSYLESGRQLA